ncbi:hypothetical protein P175DRAFT_0527249 [Aspergillus ochraceoroseus IBT 24754]|uniref:Uncharacterized protein n=1 Tax=Aspergillus ochraceoroseus IBT 24754 TaxID=1392256 RepID=A0A2T5M5I5_9EURO|nr:uncharacterized protein P175DRAFT_0527249 [Aspergillus ochraceoroseus IBT 24754]PTU23795.1 hypothetical protein P175DRAFT_0527249 [Aspergillus ochraceoroseus IBT 24754]
MREMEIRHDLCAIPDLSFNARRNNSIDTQQIVSKTQHPASRDSGTERDLYRNSGTPTRASQPLCLEVACKLDFVRYYNPLYHVGFSRFQLSRCREGVKDYWLRRKGSSRARQESIQYINWERKEIPQSARLLASKYHLKPIGIALYFSGFWSQSYASSGRRITT